MLFVEHEVQHLKGKVQELSEENVALREINIKFQLENYKLLNRIKSLEKSQVESCLAEADYSLKDAAMNVEEEYLEEEEEVPEDPALITIDNGDSHLEVFDETNQIDEQFTDLDEVPQSPDAIDDFIDIRHEDGHLDPLSAMQSIYQMAAKKGVLERLKLIQPGKSKDSYFINKVLDVVFGRKVLAESSARGQKCQSQSHRPARPALEEKKLSICRQGFIYRLKKEELSANDRDLRLKHFNSYVNFKIQNARKLFVRSQKKYSVNGP